MPVVQGAFFVVLILFFVLFFYFVPLGMWVQAVVSLVLGRIRIVDLIRMRLWKISPRLVVDGVINTHKAGLDHISTDMLESINCKYSITTDKLEDCNDSELGISTQSAFPSNNNE